MPMLSRAGLAATAVVLAIAVSGCAGPTMDASARPIRPEAGSDSVAPQPTFTSPTPMIPPPPEAPATGGDSSGAGEPASTSSPSVRPTRQTVTTTRTTTSQAPAPATTSTSEKATVVSTRRSVTDPHGTVRKDDPSLAKGTTKVATPGRDEITEQTLWSDGSTTSKVVQERVDEVVLVGTKVAVVQPTAVLIGRSTSGNAAFCTYSVTNVSRLTYRLTITVNGKASSFGPSSAVGPTSYTASGVKTRDAVACSANLQVS